MQFHVPIISSRCINILIPFIYKNINLKFMFWLVSGWHIKSHLKIDVVKLFAQSHLNQLNINWRGRRICWSKMRGVLLIFLLTVVSQGACVLVCCAGFGLSRSLWLCQDFVLLISDFVSIFLLYFQVLIFKNYFLILKQCL